MARIMYPPQGTGAYHMSPQQRKTKMSTNEVGSKISANNGFAQNGLQGASSDLPGQNSTASASLKPKNSDPAADVTNDGNTPPTRRIAL